MVTERQAEGARERILDTAYGLFSTAVFVTSESTRSSNEQASPRRRSTATSPQRTILSLNSSGDGHLWQVRLG